MAKNFTWAALTRSAKLDAIRADYNSGYLRIYDGSQPAGPDTAIGAQNLLAELRFNATAFPAASSGVLTANAITSDSSANMTGTASWFRCLKSDGTTALSDGTVGTATSNLILATTSIVAAAVVEVTSFTITDAAGERAMTEIVIRVDERGQMSMSAPLDNPMLCCWLLDLARDMVKDHFKVAQSKVIPASGDDVRNLALSR